MPWPAATPATPTVATPAPPRPTCAPASPRSPPPWPRSQPNPTHSRPASLAKPARVVRPDDRDRPDQPASSPRPRGVAAAWVRVDRRGRGRLRLLPTPTRVRPPRRRRPGQRGHVAAVGGRPAAAGHRRTAQLRTPDTPPRPAAGLAVVPAGHRGLARGEHRRSTHPGLAISPGRRLATSRAAARSGATDSPPPT